MLKKLFLIISLICCFGFSAYSADELTLSAHSAVLINADTLEVIYEKNAYEQRSMASTTKIMTALLAIESGRMSQQVTAKNMASEGTSIGLKDGYKMSLESLVWGMLLESGNDAAKLTANFLAGSEEKFAQQMNRKANVIGMSDTCFVTASGLDSEEHYTTAYDMALLGACAVKNPLFREICSSKTKTVRFIEPEITMTFSNHNKLLYSCEGAFGIKTGFTKKSGRCLVSACERNGITLIAVTLNAGDDWNDHIRLYNYGYDKIKTERLYLRLPDIIAVQGGKAESTLITSEVKEPMISFSGEKGSITQKIYLPRFVYAPVIEGETLGKVEIYRNNKLINTLNIVAKTAVEPAEYRESKSLLTRFKEKISDMFIKLKG